MSQILSSEVELLDTLHPKIVLLYSENSSAGHGRSPTPTTEAVRRLACWKVSLRWLVVMLSGDKQSSPQKLALERQPSAQIHKQSNGR